MFNVFITNLGKYNEGELVGEWVSLPCNDLEAVYERIGIDEEYEEMFITDFENDFGYSVGEYESIDELNELAEELENLDDTEMEELQALLENGETINDAINMIDDCIMWYGCHDMEDVAREYCEQCGVLDGVPENLQCYFDFDAFGRDMSFEGTFIFTDSGCVEIRR